MTAAELRDSRLSEVDDSPAGFSSEHRREARWIGRLAARLIKEAASATRRFRPSVPGRGRWV